MPPLVWTTPWALAGLAAIPALVAIYWLRFRYRPQPVSTLMFWRDIAEVRDAGIRWQKLQLPLLFFLELLAMLALVSAAGGLHVLLPEHTRPLVVILDDSLSMQAGQPSAREQAERELRELLRQRRFASVRLLLAGTTPQWLGEAVRDPHALDPMLAQWQCLQPAATLERALALAREYGGREALVLVLTDSAPVRPPEGGWLQWWAFGSANKNLAIVHALRTAGAERDRLVLEVANFASEPAPATLTMRSGQTILQTTSLSLEAGETQTLHYTVPSQAEVIEAVLAHGELTPTTPGGPGGLTPSALDDALALDNPVWLVRADTPAVRIRLDVAHAGLVSALEKALRAAGPVVFDDATPHLWITDSPSARPSGSSWLMQLLLEKDGEAFTGPYFLDRQHPLCEGLSLQDVVWGARREPIPGTPILSVGDVPLLTEILRGLNRRQFCLRVIPKLSNLTRTPDWPIFWANLVDWRRRELPGPDTVMARIGETVRVRCEITASRTERGEPSPVQHAAPTPAVPVVTCRWPNGGERHYAVHQGVAWIELRQLGLHEIRFQQQRWTVAVNMLQRSESDLRKCSTGRFGQWVSEEILRRYYYDTGWAFLLLAIGLLLVHGWLVWRMESRPRHDQAGGARGH